jgi:hypothetical protein
LKSYLKPILGLVCRVYFKMAEEEGSSSKPPRFSGKQEHYQIFNTRYKAYAKMKEFSQAVDCKGADPDLPMAAVNTTATAYTKEEKATIRKNDKAMYNRMA